MKLVFVGIQGCGKGTQARILAENFGFKVFETGGVLRSMAKQDTELGKLIKETIEAGKHVSPAIVEQILEDILKNNEGENLIFDGFVRNKGNQETFDKILKNAYQVVYFTLPEQEAKKRLLGRMYDPVSGETFMSGTTHNPSTGTVLIKRSDDEEDAILERIRLFYEASMPVIQEYITRGIVIEVNAFQSISDVTRELVDKLKLAV